MNIDKLSQNFNLEFEEKSKQALPSPTTEVVKVTPPISSHVSPHRIQQYKSSSHCIKLAHQHYQLTQKIYHCLTVQSEQVPLKLYQSIISLWTKKIESPDETLYLKMQALYRSAINQVYQALNQETSFSEEMLQDITDAFMYGSLQMNGSAFIINTKSVNYNNHRTFSQLSHGLKNVLDKITKIKENAIDLSIFDEEIKYLNEMIFQYAFNKEMQTEELRNSLIHKAQKLRDQLLETVAQSTKDLFFIQKEIGDLNSNIALLKQNNLKDLQKHCNRSVSLIQKFLVKNLNLVKHPTNFITTTIPSTKKTLFEDQLLLSLLDEGQGHYSLELDLHMITALEKRIKTTELDLTELLKHLKNIDYGKIQSYILNLYKKENRRQSKLNIAMNWMKSNTPNHFLESVLKEIHLLQPSQISCDKLWNYYFFLENFIFDNAASAARNKIMEHFKAHFSSDTIEARLQAIEVSKKFIEEWKKIQTEIEEFNLFVNKLFIDLDSTEADLKEEKEYVHKFDNIISIINEMIHCHPSLNEFKGCIILIKGLQENIENNFTRRKHPSKINELIDQMQSILLDTRAILHSSIDKWKESKPIVAEISLPNLLLIKKTLNQKIEVRTFAQALTVLSDKGLGVWQKTVETKPNLFRFTNFDLKKGQKRQEWEPVSYPSIFAHLMRILDRFPSESLSFYGREDNETTDPAVLEFLTSIDKFLGCYRIDIEDEILALKKFPKTEPVSPIRRYRSYHEDIETTKPHTFFVLKELLEKGEWHPKHLEEVIESKDSKRCFDSLIGAVIGFACLKKYGITYIKEIEVLKSAINKLIVFLDTEVVSAIKKQYDVLLASELVDVTECDETGNIRRKSCVVNSKNGRHFLDARDIVTIKQPDFAAGVLQYPSGAKTREEYLDLLMGFTTKISFQPPSFLTSLFQSIALNVPSEDVVKDELYPLKPVIIFKDTQVDILRLESFSYDHNVIFSLEAHSKMDFSDKEKVGHIVRDVLKAFKYDNELVQNLLKVSTQAMMGGLSYRLFELFNNVNLGLSTKGAGINIDITSSEALNELFINYHTIFTLVDFKDNTKIGYLKGEREIRINRDELRKGGSEGAVIKDYISPWDNPKYRT